MSLSSGRVTIEKSQFVENIKEKGKISSVFLVKFSALAVGKNGKPYMSLVLMDRTGEIEARIWENADQWAGQVVRDAFVWVEGNCQIFQERRQIVIRKLEVLREDQVNLKDYLAEGELDPHGLYEQLLGYVDSMKDPYYKALAESVLKDDSEIVSRIMRAPAAKTLHHAYPSGLLEHVVSITGILDYLSQHYGKLLDRDLLFLGGFFHDIGKIWELTYDRVTDYTTEGKLIGHLVMGVELVERKIRELENQPGRLPGKFPENQRLLVKHVILAHHGELEYGSPKRPKCLEALIVHTIDNLDSKVNAIHEFIKKDKNPGDWTILNRNYSRFFYKGKKREDETP